MKSERTAAVRRYGKSLLVKVTALWTSGPGITLEYARNSKKAGKEWKRIVENNARAWAGGRLRQRSQFMEINSFLSAQRNFFLSSNNRTPFLWS